MDPFFIDDEFFSGLCEYFDDKFSTDFTLEDYEDEDQYFRELPDDFTLRIEHTNYEHIFQFDESDKKEIINSIFDIIYDNYNERFPIENDRIDKEIKSALLDAIDFDKINKAIPKLYYPNRTFTTLTKVEILEHFNI